MGKVSSPTSLEIQEASRDACHFIQEDEGTFRVHLCYSELSVLSLPTTLWNIWCWALEMQNQGR